MPGKNFTNEVRLIVDGKYTLRRTLVLDNNIQHINSAILPV